MDFRELTILLPCHSLEDFPTHHEGDDAEGLLANWSALWHPALVASAKAMPVWHRADAPPEDLAGKLVVVPRVGQSQVAAGFLQRAEREAACLVFARTCRESIVSAALQARGESASAWDPALAEDFLALGYCYLQVELLTRQMRYSSNLDEIHFQNLLIAAAQAAVQGDNDVARAKLQACYDALAEERDHYYPVNAFILDLTLVAPTTIGESLRAQLGSGLSTNLVLSGDTLERMAREQPETLQAVRQGIAEGRVGLVASEAAESRVPLISCETFADQLRNSLDCFESLLGVRPVIYGRRRFGLNPQLPQILSQCGFTAALHFTLDDGLFPEGSQAKVRWEGCDGTTLDSLARAPLDASRPKGFLNYGVKMGEAMDMDHVASVCLAHWPGTPSTWYGDLRRIARYGAALGKFTTVEQYFRDTDLPVHQDRFQADQYRSPYLVQAVARATPDPISASVRYWQRRVRCEAARNLRTMASLVSAAADPADAAAQQELALRLAVIDAEAERSLDDPAGDQRDSQRLADAVRGLGARLPREESPARSGCLVFNPQSFVRRLGLTLSGWPSLPLVERPIYAAAERGGNCHVVVDVPPLGFVWIEPGGAAASSKKPPEPLAGSCTLRNEFFQAAIDEATGALKGIYPIGQRGNRLSQQLAMRLGKSPRRKTGDAWRDDDESAHYSVMSADSVTTTIATPVLGEILTRGRLRDRQGKELAEFQQTYRLWRGSRVLEIEIQLEPLAECQDDPWNSYFAARFAWANESASLHRGVCGARQPTSANRFEAPLYVEIDDGGGRLAILTGGLPFHRRRGLRKLDSLLLVRGETCRRFRLGIAVEPKHALHEALGLLTPETALSETAAPPSPNRSGWLFHLDARHVTATAWEPVEEGDRTTGFRVRLQETGGRPAKLQLSSFRPLSRARRIDLRGESPRDCAIENGAVELQLAAHQWSQVEAFW